MSDQPKRKRPAKKVQVSAVDAAEARAALESTKAALEGARPTPLCVHPRQHRVYLGYLTRCGACGHIIR